MSAPTLHTRRRYEAWARSAASPPRGGGPGAGAAAREEREREGEGGRERGGGDWQVQDGPERYTEYSRVRRDLEHV